MTRQLAPSSTDWRYVKANSSTTTNRLTRLISFSLFFFLPSTMSSEVSTNFRRYTSVWHLVSIPWWCHDIFKTNSSILLACTQRFLLVGRTTNVICPGRTLSIEWLDDCCWSSRVCMCVAFMAMPSRCDLHLLAHPLLRRIPRKCFGIGILPSTTTIEPATDWVKLSSFFSNSSHYSFGHTRK